MSENTRTTYRHGNVREDALAAAHALIAESGYEKLSIRRVSDQVGIAHRSLYNHFEDRDALLDAVATEGYEAFAKALKTAETVDSFVGAYTQFAFKNPHLYALMTSRPHATMKEKPELQKAAHLAITEAIRIFSDQAAPTNKKQRSVFKVYMMLHGGLSLYQSGILDMPSDKAFVKELIAMVEEAS
ncbi:MAG: TetR/AcrR family transcriptional regulator [Rhodobiaceae bacterium]|nr:TetR/AcrR family transcriptional regulator [Rhodobiaceae bacterium]